MAQRTRASQKAYRDTQITTNGTGNVTATKHRAVEEDDYDSSVYWLDDVVDEDDMASNSATKVPTQQSVKAYVDSNVTSTNTDLRYFEQDDFFGTALFDQSVSGTGAGTGYVTTGHDATENALGVTYMDTGTTTTGRSAIIRTLVSAGILFGLGHTIRMRFRLCLQALSDGTDTYTIYAGLLDNVVSGDQVDGAYIRYTHSVNSGKWEAVNASNNSRTAVDTGVSPTATVFQIVTITVNAGATSVSVDIDGTAVANTTNIPTGAGRETKIGFKIEKSAGTTARRIYVDWYDLLITRSTAR